MDDAEISKIVTGIIKKVQENPEDLHVTLFDFVKTVLNREPLAVTHQVYGATAIKDTVEKILMEKSLFSLTMLAPYISPYIMKILSKSSLKKLVMLVNKDKDNPQYVNTTIEDVKKAKYRSIILQRPSDSEFVHMKMMIPYLKTVIPFRTDTQIEYKEVLVPSCVICGSVNYTKRGIETSDEMLIVLRNNSAISDCEATLNALLSDAVQIYDSQQSRDGSMVK